MNFPGLRRIAALAVALSALSGCSKSRPLFSSTASPQSSSIGAPDSALPASQDGSSSQKSALPPLPVPTTVPFHASEVPAAPPSVTSTSPVAAVNDPSGAFALDAGSQSGGGTFNVTVTDAPVSGITTLDVIFSSVQVHNRLTGQVFSLQANPVAINLLNLRDGLAQALPAANLPEGIYDELRFFVSSVSVTLQGRAVQLAISPQLRDQGILIYGSFTVRNGTASNVIIDFDASRMLVFGKGKPIFRPAARLRHLHFQPAGIHVETAADGTLSLVGPAGTIRSGAMLQFTDPEGDAAQQRAQLDGSFRFDGIPRILGTGQLAILEHQPKGGGGPGSSAASLSRSAEGEDNGKDKDKDKGKGKGKGKNNGGGAGTGSTGSTGSTGTTGSTGPTASSGATGGSGNADPWTVVASLDIQIDFPADDRYPSILASRLSALLDPIYASVSEDPAQFLGLFKSNAVRFLAAKYLAANGAAIPADFILPALPVPYAFALEGPEYELPGYTYSEDAIGFFTGGPASGGCSDARLLFEGSASANDYASLTADQALAKMTAAGLPFTGLLAEYESVCRARDLSQLSCATLGAFNRGANTSLPAEAISTIDRALNSPRGGLLVSLLACIPATRDQVSAVDAPAFVSQGGCWYGCEGGSQQSYLDPAQLLAKGQADATITDPSLVPDLDSLVYLANQAGIDPLVLLASYVADHAPSKVHGFTDRSTPRIFNVQPVNGLVTSDASVTVSANSDQRTLNAARVNGVATGLVLGGDGRMILGPQQLDLVEGPNSILIETADDAGNIAQASLVVFYQAPVLAAPPPPPAPAPSPSPSPTPDPVVTPSPSPSPDPAPSPSPSPDPVVTPSPSPSPSPDPVVTPSPSPSPIPSPTPAPAPSPSPSPTPVAIPGVDPMCVAGQFIPKPTIKIGMSIDPNEGSEPNTVAGFQALGFNPTVYADADIAGGALIRDGITVFVITREVTLQPLTPDYITAVKAYIANGGSVLGEYDGAALFYTTFNGVDGSMFPNPAISLFAGLVEGGGALLPLANSTLYVSDPADPIMAGMPSSFLLGSQAAFAISGFNDNWLHTSGTFTSVGTFGLVPPGTFPAVMSARCGGGRVVFLTMTDFNVINQFPASLMINNAIHWLVGQ